MRKKIKIVINLGTSYIKTATLRQSAITFTGTLISAALSAVFYVVAARSLGPEGFGILNIAIAVATLVATVGDFGTDTGLVRFVSYYLNKNKAKADKILKLSLKIKLISGSIITICGFLASSFIAKQVFEKPELSPTLQIAFLVVFGSLILGFVLSYLKTLEKFFVWGAIQVSSNLFRLLIVFGLSFLGLLTVNSTIAIYALAIFVSAVIGMFFFVPRDFLHVKKENKVAREVLEYNKWIASFTIITALSTKLDTFISARLLSVGALGIYGVSYQLVFIIPQIVGAIGTVLSPKFASISSDKVVAYFKKTQLLVLLIALFLLLTSPLTAYFVPIVFGKAYLGAIPTFYILLLAMIVFLISVPIHNMVLYYYSYPKLFLWMALGNIFLTSIFGWLLISRYGIIGASLSVLIANIFNFIVPAVWVFRKYKKEYN